MYISKEERQKLLEAKIAQVAESTFDNKYELLNQKVDQLLELFHNNALLHTNTVLQEATEDTDDITVEVDGEVVADTTNDESVITDAEVNTTIDASTPVDNYGPKLALANMLMSAITDEYKTISMYNDVIATANNEGFEDVVKVMKHINEEESIHVGMLQQLLTTLDVKAEEVETGKQEAEEIINNEVEKDEHE